MNAAEATSAMMRCFIDNLLEFLLSRTSVSDPDRHMEWLVDRFKPDSLQFAVGFAGAASIAAIHVYLAQILFGAPDGILRSRKLFKAASGVLPESLPDATSRHPRCYAIEAT